MKNDIFPFRNHNFKSNKIKKEIVYDAIMQNFLKYLCFSVKDRIPSTSHSYISTIKVSEFTLLTNSSCS